MTEAFGEVDVAISLMKEALTLLDAPEATAAAQLLRMAIAAANDVGATGTSAPLDEARDLSEGDD